jgi:hypothetical protein
MTDEEVEIVAQELAKIGGTSWYPGREPGAILRPVTDRYRDQARVIIRAFDDLRHTNLRGPIGQENNPSCLTAG